MRVVFVTSEAVPFCKTGGLADVSGTLPVYLKRTGVEISVFLPFYREVKNKNFNYEEILSFNIKGYEAKVLKAKYNGVDFY
ncbi:MAG: glycogen synthase GlgA, partial [Caldiserica bacterium]